MRFKRILNLSKTHLLQNERIHDVSESMINKKRALIHMPPEILKNHLYFQRRNVDQIGLIFFIQNTNW